MSCASCGSSNQAEFNAEINIHFSGLANRDKPGLLVFPEILVCLDCGSSTFAIEQAELAILASGTRTIEVPGRQENVVEIALIA